MLATLVVVPDAGREWIESYVGVTGRAVSPTPVTHDEKGKVVSMYKKLKIGGLTH